MVAEKAAGRTEGGSVDLIWLNGENFAAMKSQDLLFGPFVDRLPNFRYVDTVGKPTTLVDFTIPTDGLEAPWGMAQFVFLYDTEVVADPPRSIPALLDWAKAHPGRFTYPAPPDFIGSTFLKQVLIELTPDPEVLQRPVNEADFAAATAPLWHWLEEIRPYLWRKGATFPESGPALHQLLDDGEVDFSMAFNPAEASAAINAGRLPESVRTFILEAGTIGNTHFVAIPFDASPQGRGHGGRQLPAVARGAGEQAGPERLGRRHGAQPRRPRAGRPGAFRSPAPRRRDPAARPAGAGPARAPPLLDGPDRGGVAAPLQQLTPVAGAGSPSPLLRYLPAVTLLVFLGPVVAGLLGTVLPAFGYLPVLGGERLSLEPWRQLAAAPGTGTALRLTLTSGILSSVLALGLTLLVFAAGHGTRGLVRVKRAMTPLLAVPHLATAVGLAFLIAPSGWLARLIAPAAGWQNPPDVALVQDHLGLALTLGLTLKETPFLVLMTFGALGQARADAQPAGRAHPRLRPGTGLAQGRAAAGLSADPAAGLCGPRLFPLGRRHGDRARSDHAADAGTAGAALVQRSRPRRALTRRPPAPACSWFWSPWRSACGAGPRARSAG